MSGVVLRDYQERAVEEVRQAFLDGHKAVLFQLATGGGKTITAGHILGSAAARGNESMFICNRVELVDQTSKAFGRLNIKHGIIAAGYTPTPRAPVQIASIDTLKRRIENMERWRIRVPKLVAWDECRGLGAAGWTKVYEAFGEARHLGLDATPIRLDGKGLGAFFSHMVLGPTYSELMSHGSLVPFEVYAPPVQIDLSAIRTKMGEFDQEALGEAMDKPQLVGDAVRHYLQHGRGKLGIAFSVNRKHSEHMAAEFRASGVRAVHLDGDTDKEERKRAVAAYRRREIDVLTNVDLFTAGFDVPGVEVIVDMQPTQSLAKALQKWGRASRPEEGKERAILLDHAGNVFRHGLPDMDREWSLEGKAKGRRKKGDPEEEVQATQCEACYRAYWPPPKCKYCGHVHVVETTGRGGPEHVDGELTRITPEMAKAISLQKKREVGAARSLEDLEAIERQRGYKHGWAKNVWEAKQNRAGQARAEAQARAYGGRWM